MFENLLAIAGTALDTVNKKSGVSGQLAEIEVQKISGLLLNKSDGSLEEIDQALATASPDQLAEVKKIDQRLTGIKETTEVIEALTLLTCFLAKSLKDGIDMGDALALFSKLTSDAQFQAAMLKASSGIEKIPDELADLDFEEIMTLSVLGLNFIKDIVKAIKEAG
jgi:hypothetical protein